MKNLTLILLVLALVQCKKDDEIAGSQSENPETPNEEVYNKMECIVDDEMLKFETYSDNLKDSKYEEDYSTVTINRYINSPANMQGFEMSFWHVDMNNLPDTMKINDKLSCFYYSTENGGMGDMDDIFNKSDDFKVIVKSFSNNVIECEFDGVLYNDNYSDSVVVSFGETKITLN